MIDSTDIDYFQARAREERALSDSAANPAAALIHLNLAKRYERLASAGIPQRQPLHIPNQSGPTVSTQPVS